MEIIEKRHLANDTFFTVCSLSKRMTADRWLLRIACEAKFPLPEEFFTKVPDDDPKIKAEVRKRMGETLKFTMIRERTFIDEADKAASLAGMATEAFDNVTAYLINPQFPFRLFLRRYEALKQACLIERHYSEAGQTASKLLEEDGPADFSICFKD